jgi:hypothetical protein
MRSSDLLINRGDPTEIVRLSIGNVQSHAAIQAQKRLSPIKMYGKVKSKVLTNLNSQKKAKRLTQVDFDYRRTLNVRASPSKIVNISTSKKNVTDIDSEVERRMTDYDIASM